MPAKGKVSIIWQLIFALFVTGLSLWVFYRIKKLRKITLYTLLPSVTLIILIIIFVGEPHLNNGDFSNVLLVEILVSAVSLPFTILYMYFIYTWSVAWNKQFENV